MTDDEFRYKSQDVDYLGFLEAQLRDLQGIPTLAFELIQNADDVKDEAGRPQTSRLTFDVTDEALIVANDGVFRPVDFERLQSVASGGKRYEAGTTGAFGIGFVAVYQVTDRPEIYSSGRHWVIHPEAPRDQRIQERSATTAGTRFRLPWAFDPASAVRRTLRLEAIRSDQLDDFVTTLADAISLAALFLKQLQLLEVRRNGELVRRIERSFDAEQQLVLRDEGGQTETWLLFDGDFAAEAARLREQYPWQIEATRQSEVLLALPAARLDEPGRLFAVLPTADRTPLPFHINADFFPTTDRKRIHFDGGYQAEWNAGAVQCAATILARQFDLIQQQLEPVPLWHLLHQVARTEQMAAEGELPDVFGAFWQALAPSLRSRRIVHTSQGAWRVPADVRLLSHPLAADATTTSLLDALDIPTVHPDLATYTSLMARPALGAPELTIEDISDGLLRAGLSRPMPLHELPEPFNGPAAWQILWSLIERLLARLERRDDWERAVQVLRRPALALTEAMILVPLDQVYHGEADTRALFPEVAWAHPFMVPDRFPGRLVPQFGVRQAVERLAATPWDQLETAWRHGRLDLPALFRWFEAHQIEIFADDPGLQTAIRRLPLCPVAGELRPLADLYMPGRFEDPLRLAGLVDLAALGGRRQFLRDLGVRELDFDSYVQTQLPRALKQQPDLPSDARHRLIQLLAARLGELRDDEALREQLGQLPLIPCLDGSFRPATQVYLSREVMALLGERVHIAEPVDGAAVLALYQWLGVRDEPATGDIITALLAISGEWRDRALDDATQATVQQCWLTLAARLKQGGITAGALAPLPGHAVIPNRRHVLTRPSQLVIADRADLAGRFDGLDDHLLAPDEAWLPAAVAVGVPLLSQAARLVIVESAAARPDHSLQERIAIRRPLLERLLRGEEGVGDPAAHLEFLSELQVWQLPHLQVQYQLPLGEQVLTSTREDVAATLLANQSTMYVAGGEGEPPWTAIARELASAIRPGHGVGSLAIGVRELLAAPTFAAGEQILDELGYP